MEERTFTEIMTEEMKQEYSYPNYKEIGKITYAGRSTPRKTRIFIIDYLTTLKEFEEEKSQYEKDNDGIMGFESYLISSLESIKSIIRNRPSIIISPDEVIINYLLVMTYINWYNPKKQLINEYNWRSWKNSTKCIKFIIDCFDKKTITGKDIIKAPGILQYYTILLFDYLYATLDGAQDTIINVNIAYDYFGTDDLPQKAFPYATESLSRYYIDFLDTFRGRYNYDFS